MEKTITIRCSGVPEHFNLPWIMALRKGLFSKAGICLQWKDNPSGTGAMCQDLRNGKIDVALLLTEGAVRDIVRGNPSKIVSTYVESPLIWGVHKGPISPLQSDKLPAKLRVAISRYTSGSHLMANVYAQQKGIAHQDLRYSIVHDLEGAKHAVARYKDQVFLWEKYTTQPQVDAGFFIRIDQCPTPWPAFVVVATDAMLEQHAHALEKVLSIVQNQARLLKEDYDHTILMLVEEYGLNPADARSWLNEVNWAQESKVDLNMLRSVGETLQELGLIEGELNPTSWVAVDDFSAFRPS
ncbi:MAG: ABC transporter substrate-binding protein [Salibacteraceae bacterium]